MALKDETKKKHIFFQFDAEIQRNESNKRTYIASISDYGWKEHFDEGTNWRYLIAPPLFHTIQEKAS